MGKRFGKFALGAIFVGIAGYIAGILTAPKSGRETRQDIRDKAVQTKDEAEKHLKQMQTEMDDLLVKAKDILSARKGEAKDAMSKAMEQAKVARAKTMETVEAIRAGKADDKNLEKAIQEAADALKNFKMYLSKNV